jgi:hypothetical protein
MRRRCCAAVYGGHGLAMGVGWAALVLLLCGPTGSHANTRFGYGTIISVDPDGSSTRLKQPNYTVRFEMRNVDGWRKPWFTSSYPFRGMTRHGPTVFFLDGRLSPPEEALQAGRAICHTANDMFIFVSSRRGPDKIGAAGTLDEGLWMLSLPGAIQFGTARVGSNGAGEKETVRAGATVILDLTSDGVRGALVPPFDGVLEQRCDATGLRREKGHLVGSMTWQCTLSQGTPGDKSDTGYQVDGGNQTIAVTVELDAVLDGQGTVSGSFAGTSAGAATQGRVSGRAAVRSSMPAAPRAWIELDAIPAIRQGFVIWTFTDGRADPQGAILFSKGHELGRITAANMTLNGQRMQGTLTGVIGQQTDKPMQITIDAHVLGNRLLGGNCTMTMGEQTVRTAMHGGLCEQDAGQIGDGTKEQTEQAKQKQQQIKEGAK